MGLKMTNKEAKRTVLIIITLDTKGDEARFLKERILEDGLDVIILDSGILGAQKGSFRIFLPDTARAAGPRWRNCAAGSRGAAVEEMLKGVALTAKLQGAGFTGDFSEGRGRGWPRQPCRSCLLVSKIIIRPCDGILPFGPFIVSATSW
jgi:hypothetical protein